MSADTPVSNSAWQRVLTLHRRLGGWATAGYLLHRTLQAVSGGRAALVVYGLYAQPLLGPVGSVARVDPRWQVFEASACDSVHAASPRPRAALRARWSAGARCFALTRDQAFAGHIWILTKCYSEDEIRCDFLLDPPNETVWDFDVYIAPEFRLSRGLQRLWSEVDRQLYAEGRRWTLSRISLFNSASIRSHERLGAVRTGWVAAFVLSPLQLTISGRPPWMHLSVSDRSRPVVTVRAQRSRSA